MSVRAADFKKRCLCLFRCLANSDIVLALLGVLGKGLVAVEEFYALDIIAANEMDGIEFAARGADAAADALVLVDDGGAAAKAAGGLFLELLLGEGRSGIMEAACVFFPVQRTLTRRAVKSIRLDGVLVEVILIK